MDLPEWALSAGEKCVDLVANKVLDSAEQPGGRTFRLEKEEFAQIIMEEMFNAGS